MSVGEVVTRAGWGARKAKRTRKLALPTPDPVTVHHAAAEWHGPEGMRELQDFHMDSRGWPDVGYHYAVDDDGTVYEGRQLDRQGSHSEGENDTAHGIVFLGNFVGDRYPSWDALHAAARLIAHGATEGWWPAELVGHQDMPGAATACPGNVADLLPELRVLVNDRLHAGTAGSTVQEDDDMPPKPEWLPAPIVATAVHPGGGYYQVAADGGVFCYGGAPFFGSLGGTQLAYPITGIGVDPGGEGYVLCSSDGGAFTFGAVRYAGSLPDDHADGRLDGRMASGAG